VKILASATQLERIYPEFPAEEYEARNKTARQAMKKQGIDALFITAKENVEYFTGYISGYWKPTAIDNVGIGIIPRDDEPLLVIPDFLRGTAERTAWVRKMRDHHDTHRKPRDFAGVIANAFVGLGLSKGIIGYETGPELSIGMPFVDFEAVRRALSEAKFVSGCDVIWACRSHKSPLEVERLEKANAITFKGYDEARRTVRVGMTEKEIARVFQSVFLKEGGDAYRPNGLGFFNIRAGEERYAMADSIPQERELQKGDVLSLNLGAVYRGYKGHTARYAFVGDPTEKHWKVDKRMRCIRDAIVEFLKPGLTGSDFHNYVHEVVANADLDLSRFESHIESPVGGICTGLNVHEHPRIAVGLKECTEARMCITMTTWLYDLKPGGLGVFSWEHPFITTESGNRPLVGSHLEEETWVI